MRQLAITQRAFAKPEAVHLTPFHSANAKGVDFSVLVNNLLRKDIELIEMTR